VAKRKRKKRAVKFYSPGPGELREVPLGGSRYEACCDCGLVHYVEYPVVGNKAMERVYRADRMTARMRRLKVARGELIKEDASNAYVLILRIRQNRGRKPLHVKYEPIPADRRRHKGRFSVSRKETSR
jgi:hypothetical protein